MKQLEKPSWFTMNERPPNQEEFLNGNGDTEEEIFDTCIKYLKEDFFWFLKFPSLENKLEKIKRDNSLDKFKPLIEKYLI